jgi:hypothetical protein
MPFGKEVLMQGDSISGSQDSGSTEAATSVARSREVAERLWAEIGRLLTDSQSGSGRASGRRLLP